MHLTQIKSCLKRNI